MPVPSHPIGRFPWDSHRNDIPMDKPGVVHGTYLSVPFPSHSNLCLSHPMGHFPWDCHRNDIPMDNPENNDTNLKRANYWSLSVCRLHDNTGIPNLECICLSEGVHLRLGIQGKNIFIYIFSKYYRIRWIFVILLGHFAATNFRVHTHLSKR